MKIKITSLYYSFEYNFFLCFFINMLNITMYKHLLLHLSLGKHICKKSWLEDIMSWKSRKFHEIIPDAGFNTIPPRNKGLLENVFYNILRF